MIAILNNTKQNWLCTTNFVNWQLASSPACKNVTGIYNKHQIKEWKKSEEKPQRIGIGSQDYDGEYHVFLWIFHEYLIKMKEVPGWGTKLIIAFFKYTLIMEKCNWVKAVLFLANGEYFLVCFCNLRTNYKSCIQFVNDFHTICLVTPCYSVYAFL